MPPRDRLRRSLARRVSRPADGHEVAVEAGIDDLPPAAAILEIGCRAQAKRNRADRHQRRADERHRYHPLRTVQAPPSRARAAGTAGG